MVPVQTMVNELPLLFTLVILVNTVVQPFLDNVQNEIRVFLCCRCENYQLKNVGHVFQELKTSWTKFEFLFCGHEMY